MPELQACKRSLPPSALPVLASLVSLSLGLAAVSSARAHKAPAFEQIGTASWYGPRFHGKKTANGEAFNQNKLTAAHRNLPLGTRVEVTNVTNGKSVEVKITDRGPYVNGRVIDLSRAAAIQLGMKDAGLARVQIVALTGNYRRT
jgi:rare lipoprotein A